MQNNRKIGSLFEKKAAMLLRENGLLILEKNYRDRFGEIDLIALDKDCVVFVEVKYRAGEKAGTPFSAVNFKKQQRISRLCDRYRMEHQISEFSPMRFDVIGFTGQEATWLKNAFDYIPKR